MRSTLRNDAASGTGVFQVRFSSPFTTSTPIEIANGAFGTTELSAFNLASTTQTFDGQVSGSGSYVRTASAANNAGTTVFNAANTYSGGTTLNRGFIGIGNNAALGTGGLAIAANTDAKGLLASGGARVVSNSVDFGAATASTTEIAGSNSLELSGSMNLGAAERTLVVSNSADTIFSGVISGSGGGIYKDGAGKLILTGANTYTGDTTVASGTLRVDNTTGSGTGTGSVAVTAAGTLEGNGTIGGSVFLSGGTIAAGNSIGSLDIGGNLTLNSGNFEWEFSGGGGTAADNAVALGADLYNVGGTLKIMSAVSLVGVNLGVDPIAAVTKFTVLSYLAADATDFRFGNVLVDDSSIVIGGVTYIINYNDTTPGVNGGTGGMSYVTLTTPSVAAVPELSSVLTVGLAGVFAFGAIRLGKRFGFSFKV